jgi:hypothetical protein
MYVEQPRMLVNTKPDLGRKQIYGFVISRSTPNVDSCHSISARHFFCVPISNRIGTAEERKK